MTDTLRTQLIDELNTLVAEHFASLNRYVTFVQPEVEALDCLVVALESLAAVRHSAADHASYAQFHQVRLHLAEIDQFLQQVNQDSDSDLMQTQIGEILAQAREWYAQAREQFRSTRDEVWDLINPVRPDTLKTLGDDVYEARWWKPVPMMDVELLRYTEGVEIQQPPFEPESLPGGIAVRFKVEIPQN